MTILSTSGFYERANRDMTTLRRQAESLQAQIASGKRINASSDDPLGAAHLRALARAENFAQANIANANRATSDLSLADRAMQEIAENLIRAQELAVQAASDTTSDGQRLIIGEQIEQIREHLVALANSKDGSGNALFGGESPGNAYTFDAAGNPVYIGTASSGELPLGDGQSVVRGVTGPEFLNFNHNGSATDLFAVLGNLATALTGGSADPAGDANVALDAMKTGLDRITTTQTVIGARMNWVDMNMSRIERQGEMRAEERSRVGDVDAATAITQLQQILTVLEASQASFVRLSNLSLFDQLR